MDSDNVSLNLDKVINKLLPKAIARGLMDCALIIENDAKRKCPVDDGILRASITHRVDEKSCKVGTNVEYAAYVHEGTGLYAKDGLGRKSVPWKYKDAEGKWHTTKGQKPQPFLQDAVNENMDSMVKVFEGLLEDE